jgi:hypothetical protein
MFTDYAYITGCGIKSFRGVILVYNLLKMEKSSWMAGVLRSKTQFFRARLSLA